MSRSCTRTCAHLCRCAGNVQLQVELQDSKLTVQRLEAQLQQGSKSAQRSQRDFDLAIKARDEAVRESQRLLSQVEALEERARKSV